ncbi:MAG TPA: DMT family transporter [Pyrinomonadaceae bacterium]|jgi:drug/metabolite transporter (DMT)-like permease|nr:DMT family transporter [Pyrinomonadaceae bacterium]
MKLKSNLGADGAILLTTLIWGSTFAVARDILDQWPPLAYLALRMPLAALLFAALFPRRFFGARRAAWKAGATLGLLIGIGFLGQTVGLVFTTPAKSAFVSGITTPLIPFVAYLLFRARPSRENLAGVVLASIGGALILAPAGTGRVNTGDLITLGTTFLFATHVSLMSVYARRFDIRQLSALQIAVAAAFCVAAWVAVRAYVALAGVVPSALAREAAPLAWSAPVVWQLIYLATVATVVVFLLWTWGQARMSATHAAVIFSLEPVFALLFAVVLRGSAEWTGGRATVGALLVVAGVVVAELRWGDERREAEGVEQEAAADGRDAVES